MRLQAREGSGTAAGADSLGGRFPHPLPTKVLRTTDRPALPHLLPQAFQTTLQSTSPSSVLRIHISTFPLHKQSTPPEGIMNLSKLREVAEGRGDWCAAVHGVAKSQTRLGH